MKKKDFKEEIGCRRDLIATADSTVAECERSTAVPIDTNAQAKRHWRRAAKLYGTAAELYRRSGLGLRAIAAWKAAADCFEALGMPDDCERCRLRSVSIPVYYEEVNDGPDSEVRQPE